MPNTFKEKLIEQLKNQQEGFYKDRQEQDGVLFKNAKFYNPEVGKVEDFGDVDKKTFSDLVSKGFTLQNYDQKNPELEKIVEENKDVSLDLNPTQVDSKAYPVTTKNSPGRVARVLRQSGIEEPDWSSSVGKIGQPQQEEKDIDLEKLNEINEFLSSQGAREQPSNIESVEYTKQTQKPVSFGLPYLGTEAFDKEAKAIKELGDIDAKLAEEKALLTKDFAEQQRLLDIQEQERKQKQAERRQQKVDEFNKAVEDFSNAEIQAPNIWAGKSAGQKILLGLGLFLGSAPNSSGQNRAGAAVENLLNRDLEVQKLELEKKKQGLDYKKNLLTQLDDIFKDEDLAANAARQVQLNYIQNKLNSLADQSASEKIKKNAEIASSAAEKQKADYKLRVYDSMLRKEQLDMEKLKLTQKSPGMLPGQEAADKEFGKEYVEWKKGGKADALKNLSQLKEVQAELESGEKNLTGRLLGRVPDLFKPESAIDTRELVEEVVQRNLRTILGAQFTEKEGERLIKRAYNPNLDEKENAKRLERLIKQMETAVEQKDKMSEYFEKTGGTLSGYEGPRVNLGEFEQKVVVTDGKRKLEIPRSDLNEALRSGFKQVR